MNSKATITPTITPARYFPLKRGHHDVSPGLFRFGTDFGNGQQDKYLFQIDSAYNMYRKNKLVARDENVNKYVCHETLDTEVQRNVNLFFLNHLAIEHRQFFSLFNDHSGYQLQCRLTGDRLDFNSNGDFRGSVSDAAPAYTDSWDAWGCQLQEDLALVDGSNRVIALHLCAPNHWAATDKLGQNFMAVHEPVPGFASHYPAHDKMLQSLVKKGPYVRFAWGLSTDSRLNHHPQTPADNPAAQWNGRTFSDSNSDLYIRIERQCILGLPEINAFLFTIRTYFTDIKDLDRQHADILLSVLRSMDDRTIKYKGLTEGFQIIVERLEKLYAQS